MRRKTKKTRAFARCWGMGHLISTRRAIALATMVAAFIGTAFFASSASAYQGLPDDLSGYAWTGKVEAHWEWLDGERPHHQAGHKGQFVLVDLDKLDKAGTDYGGQINVQNSEQYFYGCTPEETDASLSSSRRIDYHGKTPIEANVRTSFPMFNLQVREDGFFYAPYGAGFPARDYDECTGEDISQSEPLGSLAGLGQASGREAQLQSDTDPDPYHFVGTESWSLARPPAPMQLSSAMQRYSYTLTYDLRLVKADPVKPQCSDGKDNDFDGFTDFGPDPKINDPGCASADDDDESDDCADSGVISKDWDGGSILDNLGFGEDPDITYGLLVRWCTPATGPPQIRTKRLQFVNHEGSSSNLSALGKTLNETVGLSFKVRWRRTGRQVPVVDTLGDETRVTASTGHADVCVNILSFGGFIGQASRKVAIGALKRVGRKKRLKLLQKAVGAPARLAAKTIIKPKNFKAGWLKLLREQNGKTKVPLSPKDDITKSINQRANALAAETAEARIRAVVGTIELAIDKYASLEFSEVCTKAWEPKVVATIARGRTPTMTLSGFRRGAIWSVSGPR